MTPLTGVYNRMALKGSLAREVDLAQRQDLPLSVLVIDIDHFKQFNDLPRPYLWGRRAGGGVTDDRQHGPAQ